MVDLERLYEPMEEGGLKVVRLAEEHKEGLRACCDPADPVWDIYPVNYSGEYFDKAFAMLGAATDRTFFAIIEGSRLRGITAYIAVDPSRQSLEIGGTLMAMDSRGTGLNTRVKRLLLDRAFACGIRRVEFRIDERNTRSQAAVRKLGAVKEGVLRAERITWTGHVRDTGVYSLLAEEWAARNA